MIKVMATVVMAVLISLILNVALLYCYSVKLVEILDELFDKYSEIEDMKFDSHLNNYHKNLTPADQQKRSRVELERLSYGFGGKERSPSK